MVGEGGGDMLLVLWLILHNDSFLKRFLFNEKLALLN